MVHNVMLGDDFFGITAVVHCLNELDKTEWFDVCRKLRPDLTWDEYEIMWRQHHDAKGIKDELKSLH